MTAEGIHYREATVDDISKLHAIRMAVKENVLSGPFVVTAADYEYFLDGHGKGWVSESGNAITGFCIVDTDRNNVWALFVHPRFEKRGIGRELQELMLNWYFCERRKTLWLGTAPGTRAERFYTATGWKQAGPLENGEIRFEMTYADFCAIRRGI